MDIENEEVIEPLSINGRIAEPHSIDLEIIIKDPKKYIEKGCLEACLKLWDLNICTRETNGYGKYSYIVLSRLSERNLNIFRNLEKQDPDHYEELTGEPEMTELLKAKFPDSCLIKSEGSITLDLIEPFEMQDIYEGVFSSEMFLSYQCGFQKYDIDSKGNVFYTFDKAKFEAEGKTIEDYAKEKGVIYIKEEDKVYSSQFYYDRHLAYLDRITVDDGFKC